MREKVLRWSAITFVGMWLVAAPLDFFAKGEFSLGRVIALLLMVLSVPVGFTAAVAWGIGLMKNRSRSTTLHLDE